MYAVGPYLFDVSEINIYYYYYVATHLLQYLQNYSHNCTQLKCACCGGEEER